MPPSVPQSGSTVTVEFVRRVRALREEQELSQEALAARCGLHWSFVGQVERGRRSIRLDNILKLASGLGVQPGALMDDLPIAD